MSFKSRSQKLLQGLVSPELTAYLSIFNLNFNSMNYVHTIKDVYQPNNFELYFSLKFCFTNTWGLRSNFAKCESFLESNSPDILALCVTNLDDSNDSANFSVRDYLPLIWKNSITIHSLAVYVKEGLPFAWDLCLENSAASYLCFQLALLHLVS